MTLSTNWRVIMKKLIASLVLVVASCSAVPAHATPGVADYNSIQCLKFVEGDWDTVKPKLIKDLLAGANANQKMLIEDVDQNDLVVAGTNLYCENKSVPEVLEWIGL
ncbi:hypothetical protein [Salmonella phage vB_SenM-S16]|uniref:Spackle periplasmic protein n=1 Tax=Salmonella phage S16 TaxID=1087482 RepID=M1HNR4_BPS16|nr:spackle periplasmic [Salmonella phage vB_SenM-S16]AGE48147.1 hypothetical protein [Salmonella phage vB_SenM-S16]